MLSLNLNLPRVDTGPFRFVSAPRSRPHKRERPNARLSLLEWMWRYRKELAPGRPFDLDNHVYLRAIYEEQAQVVVLCKSSQAGASEYLISYILHACDQRDATGLYVFPTDGHVSDFSAARLGPAIESSDYLADIVVEGRSQEPGPEGARLRKRGADRVTLKRVRDRFLYLRGGTVKADGKAPQLKSIDADVLILDEVDELDPRAPAIAVKRLGHSAIAEQRWVSTPMYPGSGIHAKWLESDQRLWHLRCINCGEWQSPSIEQVVTEWDELGRPVVWHGQPDGRAYLACRKCGREVDRLGQGEWVATYPEREIVGYHITKLFTAQTELIQIVHNLDTTDETKRREAYNQDLGLPYRPRGGGLDAETLDACREEYGHGPYLVLPCYMGVDVGKMLHVVIRSALDPATGKRRQLFAGEVRWQDLGDLMRQYNPRTVVMDALPETTKAREFQAMYNRGRVWLAYYTTQPVGIKKERFVQMDWKGLKVDVDRTRSLDETMARFRDQTNSLPANARSIRDYYSHLLAPVRVFEQDAKGTEVAKYIESGPDHYAHAENYCTAASYCETGWGRGAG